MAEDEAQTASTPQTDVSDAQEKERGEPDFTKKHPLENRWTLWFDNPKGAAAVLRSCDVRS